MKILCFLYFACKFLKNEKSTEFYFYDHVYIRLSLKMKSFWSFKEEHRFFHYFRYWPKYWPDTKNPFLYCLQEGMRNPLQLSEPINDVQGIWGHTRRTQGLCSPRNLVPLLPVLTWWPSKALPSSIGSFIVKSHFWSTGDLGPLLEVILEQDKNVVVLTGFRCPAASSLATTGI